MLRLRFVLADLVDASSMLQKIVRLDPVRDWAEDFDTHGIVFLVGFDDATGAIDQTIDCPDYIPLVK